MLNLLSLAKRGECGVVGLSGLLELYMATERKSSVGDCSEGMWLDGGNLGKLFLAEEEMAVEMLGWKGVAEGGTRQRLDPDRERLK